MHFIAYLLMGLIAGFIGSKIVNKSGSGLIMDILIGVVGAGVGSWLVGILHWAPAAEHPLGLYSILVAVGGSVVLLLLWRAIKSAL